MLAELIKLENINLDLQAQTKDELFEEMATQLNQNGYIKNVKNLKKIYINVNLKEIQALDLESEFLMRNQSM
ncbi:MULTISPECIES: PTS sugar transporter subunit IIA [Turicibacter]|uniref:PTS sugar transporter subunit IIA n=1 Tax=Turicibacter TaxID=191303 RepID=UPI0002FF3067|nr:MULTISPECIES: PTS sugar transporter subunit IIA [Turicibacter]